MKDLLEYRGFVGSVHFSPEDDIFFGKIEGITDLVTFEGATVVELRNSFNDAVEDYLRLCRQSGKKPLKSYRGSFNVRISPELHRQASETAIRSGQSLNQLVQKAIEHEIGTPKSSTDEEEGTQHFAAVDARRSSRRVAK